MGMKSLTRRTFLRTAAAAAVLARPEILMASPRRALERVGLTTVVFRFRFAQTRRNYAGNESVKRWVDAARLLEAGSIRANAGNGDVATAVRSLREIVDYAGPLGVPVLVENHGGISTRPEVLLTILDAIPGGHFGGLTDFGNFESEVARYEALAKLAPRSWLVSAKTLLFDGNGNHASYDFDRCVRTCEEAGFQGIYSAEQWDPSNTVRDFEAIAEWMIEHISANLRA